MHRHLIATALLLTLGVARGLADEPAADKATRPARVLPGVEADGAVRLPNQWSIRPAGKQIELGDFPVNIALHPSGKWLAALHAGYGAHEIIIVDLDAKQQRIVSRVVLSQTFYGLCFAPDGKTLYASGGEFDVVHAFQFEDGFLSKHQELVVADLNKKFIAAGLAVDPTAPHPVRRRHLGPRASPSCPWTSRSSFTTIPLGKDSYPYGCLIDADGKRLYVSLWSQAGLAVIDLEKKETVANSGHGKAPDRDGPLARRQDALRRLLQLHAGERAERGRRQGPGDDQLRPLSQRPVRQHAQQPVPDARRPDAVRGQRRRQQRRRLQRGQAGQGQAARLHPHRHVSDSGALRPGDDKRLYIANGRGTSTPRPTRRGPTRCCRPTTTVREYIAGLYRGTLSIIDVPTAERWPATASTPTCAVRCAPTWA